MAETPLVFPSVEAQRLEHHLPPLFTDHGEDGSSSPKLPFVTLTFATSLDSALSLGPGIRTVLSGPQSKAMTHHLRSRHDAICVGVGTALADDPGLNCRLASEYPTLETSPAADTAGVGALLGLAGKAAGSERRNTFTTHQPRPIIIDPKLRWDFTAESKVLQLARIGRGLAPYIVTAVPHPPERRRKLLERLGGKFIVLGGPQGKGSEKDSESQRFDWHTILAAVRDEGLRSIMIEGGGGVINSFLSEENAHLIDSVIVTVAPTWLGQGSVYVSPPRKTGSDGKPRAVARLTNTSWMPLGEDVVLCGKIAPQS
ncbi:putative riboflavin biosynthesis protein Rib7 [Hypoxylon trugodes]|uniref:putative riboflavin biosynthesis protein Rib7 n=1 Tax=Hypoxylon trugodes TaxID=326681 RepID=UPI00219A6A73|nr:putative riboflavin biosynthesis protein Rib7 [Hypoxylon trugodes]KAI1386363.1 putative riboflavin biosynthesis protein Rib7 [Hypoxylon trugodes]